MATEQDGMLIEIGLTEKRYLQALAKLEAETMQAAKRTENGWKRSNGRVSKSFKSVDQSASSAAGGGMRNLSLQLSQVAQQASATGDPLRALAIQLPDMTLGFGTLGIALGVVAGALLPLAAGFLGAGDNAEAFDKTLEGLSKAVKRHEEAVMNAARPYSDLREEFGESAGQARELFDALAALERLDVISGLSETQKGVASRFGVLDQFKPEDYINAGKALASLQERLQELRDGAEPISVDEGQRIQEDINKMGELASAVQRVQVELGLTAEKAGEFAAAVSAFQTADPASEAQKDALREVRSILVDAVTESGKLTEEQRAFAVQIVESERDLLTFIASMEDAEAGTAATADQARLLADEISRAAQAALDFVSNLGSASLAGLRAEVAALEAGGSKGDAAVARREAEVRSSPEFQAAMQGPVGLQQEAQARLQRELDLTREEVALRARRTEVLREETKAKGGSASASEKLTATERLAKQVIERATEAAVKYGDVVEVLKQKLASGEISQDTFNRAVKDLQRTTSTIGQSASVAGDAMSQLFDSIASGGSNAVEILQQVAVQLLKLSLFTGLADAFPNVFGAKGSIPLVASANGNAFNHGKVTPFARGGVVSGPTLFPMANGAGLMGEAGPEAVMPLTRIGGKLGVQAKGGGGDQIVEINNYAGARVESRQQEGPNGRRMIVDLFGDAVAQGELDAPFGARFAAKPQKRRR